MGDILNRIRADWKRFSSAGGFETAATFIPISGDSISVDIIAMKHHLSYDTEGAAVNSKNTHITVSEEILTDAGYVVRNAGGEVALINHKVEYADSTGVVKKYIISENYADETVGIITCTLTDYE